MFGRLRGRRNVNAGRCPHVVSRDKVCYGNGGQQPRRTGRPGENFPCVVLGCTRGYALCIRTICPTAIDFGKPEVYVAHVACVAFDFDKVRNGHKRSVFEIENPRALGQLDRIRTVGVDLVFECFHKVAAAVRFDYRRGNGLSRIRAVNRGFRHGAADSVVRRCGNDLMRRSVELRGISRAADRGIQINAVRGDHDRYVADL